MPIDPVEYRRMVERHLAAEREARGDARRAFALFLVEVAAATLLGLLLMGLALHTGDEALARIWWYGGEVAWLAGLAVAIHRARRRAAERGDPGL